MTLQAVEVTKEFVNPAERVVALRGVSLKVNPGEFVLVRGESGSGKTTLVNVLAGIDRPDRGRVSFRGTDVSGLGERDRTAFRLKHFGLVFQDHNLISDLSAVDNVLLPLVAAGMLRSRARAKADEALASVGIGELGDRMPAQMSGGQRQRVGIARAIARDTKVIIADEPTGSLDSRTAANIFETIRALCDRGATAVVATHAEFAAAYSSRTVSIKDGVLTDEP